MDRLTRRAHCSLRPHPPNTQIRQIPLVLETQNLCLCKNYEQSGLDKHSRHLTFKTSVRTGPQGDILPVWGKEGDFDFFVKLRPILLGTQISGFPGFSLALSAYFLTPRFLSLDHHAIYDFQNGRRGGGMLEIPQERKNRWRVVGTYF